MGIFVACAAPNGLGRSASSCDLDQLYGAALICGIGFTMRGFIGLLAFPDSPLLQDEIKLGVLLGSPAVRVTQKFSSI